MMSLTLNGCDMTMMQILITNNDSTFVSKMKERNDWQFRVQLAKRKEN